ncbi:MAG: MFS transporter [Chloroflexi bacterium]|nr:MFS transporter [Chloroflexota bacterium]
MASVAAAGRLRAFSALRHRDFRWFFLNIGVQSFGQGIQFLGIGFLIIDLGGEKTALGLAVSLFGVSNLVFTFVGGVLADRVDRKLFLICCVLGNAVVTLALAFLALAGLAQIWHVYTVVFILGGLMAVQMPTRFALAADLVPREDMMNAVALHTSVGQIGNMLGPLVGGWAIQYIDTWAGIMINGVSYLLGIAFLMMVARPVATTRRNSSPISDFTGGLAHAVRTPMAAVLIFLSATFGFFGMAYMQVVPAFTTEFLRLNAFQTGVFMVCRGAGAFAGSMVVASWGDNKNKGLLMYLQLVICCVGLIAMAWSHWFWAACMLVALVGSTSIGGFWPVSSSMMQLTTAPDMRGRMMAMMQLAPVFHFLGAWPLTWLAQLYGWSAAITSGAVVLLVISLAGWSYRPMVRRMNEI